MRKQRKANRNELGQAMAAVDLLIIVPASVGCILLMLNCGMSAFYKQKLGFATTQAATYAASISRNQRERDTKEFTNELLQKMALPNDGEVKVEEVTVRGKQGVSVEVTENLSLFGDGSVIPMSIKLSDRSVAICNAGGSNSSGNADGYIGFGYNVTGYRVRYVPLVLDPDNSKPVWNVDRFGAIPRPVNLAAARFGDFNYQEPTNMSGPTRLNMAGTGQP